MLGLGAIVLVVQLAGSSAATPIVLFSNFGTGDSFDSGNTWRIWGSTVGDPPQEVAAPFSPNMSAVLTGGDFAAVYTNGATDLTATIFSDASSLPGSVLDSSSLSSFSPGVVSFAFTGGITLASGTNYWAGLSNSPTGDSGWNFTDPLQTGLLAFSNDQGSNWFSFPNDQQPAFRINAIPEPSQAVLPVAIALICLALRRFPKRAERVA